MLVVKQYQNVLDVGIDILAILIIRNLGGKKVHVWIIILPFDELMKHDKSE